MAVSAPTPAQRLFREEALAHTEGQRQEGRLLRIGPFWLRWSYRLLVAVLVAGLAFVALGRVHEVARGPAVLRVDAEGARVLALLPGNLRPRLRRGAALSLTLPEYPDARCALVVDSVDAAALAGAPLLARLGDDLAALPRLDGPVAVVQARLPRRTFLSQGRRLPYLAGMVGSAEVRLGTERLVFALLPGLSALGRSHRD